MLFIQRGENQMYSFPEEIRMAYEALPVPIVFYQQVEEENVPILYSDGFCNLVQMSRENMRSWLHASRYERMHPDDVGVVVRTTEAFAQHKSDYNLLFRCLHADGYHYIHAVGQWQYMPNGAELGVLVYLDVTDSEDMISLLSDKYKLFQKDQFYNDPLTGLPNINYLHQFADERVHALRLRGETPVLVYLDVNSMQSYNNQYGFSRGNDLLTLTARSLRETFAHELVMRGADDHFILICPLDSRESLIRRIREVNEAIKTNVYGNTTGIQAGIYIYEQDSLTTKAVDHAKHALKRLGTDLNEICRFYAQEADELYWNQRYIVENFSTALEKEWIRVYYQKIVWARSQKVAAFEALARWIDPNRGIISPAEFIPTLEKYHLLHQLDLYMFGQVCREVQQRVACGLPLMPVSVNFSAQDFDYLNVPDELDRILAQADIARYGIGKSFFILEITEQDMAIGRESFHAQIRELRRRGYGIWLDDFGSGYSSLNVFSRLDVDLVKFDKEMLSHLDDHGGANRKILRAMVQLAHEMGVYTLTEGMETDAQAAFLREIGCDLVQGFGIHRPESLDAICFRYRNGKNEDNPALAEKRRLQANAYMLPFEPGTWLPGSESPAHQP